MFVDDVAVVKNVVYLAPVIVAGAPADIVEVAVCVPVANIAVFSTAVVVSASIVVHIIALADFVVAVSVVAAAVVVFVAPENWKKIVAKNWGVR